MAITRPNVDQHYKQHFRRYQTLLRPQRRDGGCHCHSGWRAYRLQRLATSRSAIYANVPRCAVAAAASLHDCQLMPSVSHRDIRHSSPRSPRYNYAVTPCECTNGSRNKNETQRQTTTATEGHRKRLQCRARLFVCW